MIDAKRVRNASAGQLRRIAMVTAVATALGAAGVLAGGPDSSAASLETSVSETAHFPRRGGHYPLMPAQHRALSVSNCNDSGSGSLREAIAQANDESAIDLTQLSCSTISVSSGSIPVAVDNLYIGGPGKRLLTISGASNTHQDGIFSHSGSGTLHIENMTLADGIVASDDEPVRGGCIASAGTVLLENVVIDHCSARAGLHNTVTPLGGGVFAKNVLLYDSAIVNNSVLAYGETTAVGGGLWVGGTLVMGYSTIANNEAGLHTSDEPGYAGGIYVGGTARIGFSTISGNVAGVIGGAELSSQYGVYPSSIYESTISDNTAYASGSGAGLYVARDAVIRNSTISGNSVGQTSGAFGAGLRIGDRFGPANVNLQSTIIANNTVDSSPMGTFEDDIGGTPDSTISGSHNLVQTSTIAIPAGTLREDPKIGPLADNGGVTFTHALLPGSPAVGAGSNPANNATDQRGRGYPRVVGAATDIGAIESALPDEIFADGFE